MHNKIISWNDNWILIFICFVGRLLLEPSTSSSTSFITTSFLIQILRWIRGSSRIESSVFLIAWGVFFGSWELDLRLLPYSISIIMSQYSYYVRSSQSLLKVITSFWHTFLKWMNPIILGGYSRWPSPLLHSSLLLLPLQVVLWFDGLCILDLHILQLVSLGHILILFFPSNSLKFWKIFNSLACNR